MKAAFLTVGLFVGSGISLLQAGSVFVLGNSPESDGTLTLSSTGIHVDGGASSDINLSDVLEADFGETPFQLNDFSSVSSPKQLPPPWKGQDIGHPSLPGSYTYTNGTLTLTGAGVDLQRKEPEDQYYVIGQPLIGDAQLSVRIKEIDGSPTPPTSRTQAGPTVRQNLDPLSVEFCMGLYGIGSGLFRTRYGPSGPAGWAGFTSGEPPFWLRLTRSGLSIDSAISSDGQKWEIINQADLKTSGPAWIGFFVDSFSEKVTGKTVMDQITLAPGAAQPVTIPPGILLQSGSFVVGSYHCGSGSKEGGIDRDGKTVAINSDAVAAVVFHPVTRKQIDDVSSQTGLIMQNGDFLAADIPTINGSYITVNSLLLGMVNYYDQTVRACVFQPIQEQSSDYEVRLRDGSVLRAKSLDVSDTQVSINEVSGLSLSVGMDSIAQVRAGLTHAQPLIGLPWKTAPPAVPAGTPAPDASANVQCWTGPDQEQIMAAIAGAPLIFPLSGKFSALAMRVALAPDAPPDAQIIVRILADGAEIARTPAFKAGEQPRFVEVTLQSPKTVTIVADASSPGTRALFIDPVAIREQ